MRLRRRGDGHRRADRHGHAVAAPVRHPRAQGEVPRAGHDRRPGRRHRRDRARRRLRRGRPSAPGRSATATSGSSTAPKTYITNGTQADWMCLLCRTSDEGGYRGMSQIMVPTDTPGFRVSRKLDKLGMRSSDTAELVFDDVRVPVANTIGEIGRGFQQQMAQFQDERMIASYQMVGAMEVALDAPSTTSESGWSSASRCRQPAPPLRAGRPVAEVDMLSHYNYALRRADRAARTSPASPPSPSCRRPASPAASPTSACSSTVASATSRRPGRPGSSGTPGSGPSAAAPTRSCCGPSPR